jgi:hypothetical protein
MVVTFHLPKRRCLSRASLCALWIAPLDSVAKVLSKVTRQVIDSAHVVPAIFYVANVITYETYQGLYFQPFAALEGHSARHLNNGC